MSKRYFVCTDAKNNNNKFWLVDYNETTGVAVVTYGRVGTTGVVENYNWTQNNTMQKSSLN